MCLTAVQYVINRKRYELFHVPPDFVPLLERSWKEDHPLLYGRFDLCYKEGRVKLLEFNADTPTSLYEAGIVQWFWLQDFDENKDQFNSIHEKLIAQWRFLRHYLYPGPLHFTCLRGTLEDLTNVEYIRDCAIQADIETHFLYLEEIGWDPRQQVFVDKAGRPVRTLLWELFPGHPYLLPVYFLAGGLTNYVKKPILSREGANIDMVYQEMFQLPDFGNNYPLIGSWIIGREPAGIGIREAGSLITDNLSRFVPHLIE